MHYADTKLMNVLFSNELDRQYRAEGLHVVSNAIDPGRVLTEIGRDYHWLALLSMNYFGPYFLRDKLQGAMTSLHVAVHPSIQTEHVGGAFFESCAQMEASQSARDPVLARALWDHTHKVLNL
jgi:NAD(P)-dependent dehydrogenase (short-subunit alcohol dehydrogenase family)